MTRADEGPMINAGRDANHNAIANGENAVAVTVTVAGNVVMNPSNKPDFQPELNIPQPEESEDIRFLFFSDRLNFLGREDSVVQLRAFLDRPEKFLWWGIFGPGGIGKTRLAFELCRTLSDEGQWEAGFLSADTTPSTPAKSGDSLAPWESWQPKKPTLIVADYVAERARFLGALTYRLAKRRRKGEIDHPVRLLLLERDAKGPWEKAFQEDHWDTRAIQNEARHGAPMTLHSLGDDALWAIIRRMSKDKAKDRNDLLAQLHTIDSQGRPLFAAFLGDAIGQSAAPRQWDRDALLSNVLERNREKFWEPAGVTEADKNWLCLATLTGRAYGSWLGNPEQALPAFPEPLPTADDQDLIRRYNAMTGAPPTAVDGDTEFGSLQPDPLGEYFVLHRLTSGMDCYWRPRLTLWLETAWRLDPGGTAVFLTHLWEDFSENQRRPIDLFYTKPKNSNIEKNINWIILENDRGVFLKNRKNYETAIKIFDNILKLFGDTVEIQLREHVAFSFLYKGMILGKLGRAEEAIAVYDDLLNRFADETKPPLREQTAFALNSKGITLEQLNRVEEAIVVYDDLLNRFAGATEPTLREQMAEALLNKGIALGKLDRAEEAIVGYDDLLNRFAETEDYPVAEQVAMALLCKGSALVKLSRDEAAIAAYDDLLNRFADAEDPALRELVAEARANKAALLGKLGRG
ncbi:tetratricopeptide repeat protein [Rhodospirillum rubrum]|uniref:tetratricopeptide repeat protein n=1 Tax=Rhodospirillum rubrum TaxID=1085 RepID=UPI001904A832|nr:tetratricopeptide repeat protein [Rhodospirillum rubrum]